MIGDGNQPWVGRGWAGGSYCVGRNPSGADRGEVKEHRSEITDVIQRLTLETSLHYLSVERPWERDVTSLASVSSFVKWR